jgi:hypothetical protein
MTSDVCPRCGGAFHCGAADPGPCACTTIELDAALLAELRTRYAGCLCLPCLCLPCLRALASPLNRGPDTASASP